MGDGGGITSYLTAQPGRRGRRRPYPNFSQHDGQVHHTYHRRFQQIGDTNPQSVKPTYPTNPFGNDGKDAEKFPAPTGRRSSLDEAVRNGRNEVNVSAKRTSRAGCSETTWDDSRAIQEVVSVLGKGQEDLYESRSDLLRARETFAERADEHDSLYDDYKGYNSSNFGSEKGHRLQGSAPRTSSSAKAEGNQAISSGPSAIDLFDQCGFVPKGGIKKEGLVGTTNTVIRSDYDNTGVTDYARSMVESTPGKDPIVAPRDPLVPGGASTACGFRGARNHPRDARLLEARAPRTKRTQAASLKHGVQPRPPFVGGNTSTSSGSKHTHQRVSPLPGTGVKTSKEVPSDATTIDPTSRRSRALGPSNVGSPCSAETNAPVAQTDGIRVRRRWNEAGQTPAATFVPLAPARAAGAAAAAPAVGVEALYSETPSASGSASLSASEQRIASAKVRLHKDKGLDALRLEHVEALSILQDISCPSTATATSAESGLDTKESKQEDSGKIAASVSAVEATRHCSGESVAVANSSDPGSGAPQAGRGVEAQGLPVEGKLDVFAADLPRIESQQTELREMYRKWWMKVASGGSSPSPCISEGLLVLSKAAREGQMSDMSAKHRADSKDVPPVGQLGLLIQGVVAGNGGDGAAEDLCTAHRAAADSVQESRSNAFGGAASSARTAAVAAVGAHPTQGVGVGMAVVAAKPAFEGGGDHSKTCMLGEKGGRAENIIADQRETEVAGDVVLRATDVSAAESKASATEEVQNPSAGEGRNTKEVPVHMRVEVPPRKDLGGVGEAAAAGAVSTAEQADKLPAEEGNTTSGVPLDVGKKVPPREEGREGGGAVAAVTGVLASKQRQQQQQQAIVSETESVSEDDGLEKEQEEGHHGRIYLPDGRFVSTWRNTVEREKTADAVRKVESLDRVSGDGGCGPVGEVVDNSVAKRSDDESSGYEDEDFED